MKIAIVSDTHSRYETIEKALKLIAQRQVARILHCGDIEDADAAWLFPPNTHFVFGNCDADRHAMRQAIYAIGGELHEPFGNLFLDQTSIAFIHGDDKRLFEQLQESEKYDYLFYGHTHVAAQHQTGPTRVINPGALHRASKKTFVILDTTSGEMETIVVE